MVVVAVSTLLVACSSDGSSAGRIVRPAATSGSARSTLTPSGPWQKVSPASVGLDAAKLDAIAHTAEVGKSNCLVVAKDGKLAGEWYFHGTGPDTAQQVFSATKSYTSTLVGMAVDAGKAKLSDPASRWIPEWKGTASAGVTLRDLLSNDSGRDWSLAQDYVQLLRAPDATAFAVGLGQAHPPGTVWAYNNSAIQTLERVVAGTLGADIPAVAQQRIFAPLGMDHSAAHHRSQRPRADVHGAALDVSRHGALRVALPRPRRVERHAHRVGEVGAGGHRRAVDAAQRRATGSCGG